MLFKLLFVIPHLFYFLLLSLVYVLAVNVMIISPEEGTSINQHIVGKYVVLAIYPLIGFFVGVINRWRFLRKAAGAEVIAWYRRLLDACRTGSLVGGIFFVTFSSALSLWNAVVLDIGSNTDNSTINAVMWITAGITSLIAITAYFSVTEYVNRRPSLGESSVDKERVRGVGPFLALLLVFGFAWLLSRSRKNASAMHQ